MSVINNLSIQPSSPNTPLDNRVVIDSLLQVDTIRNPYIGMLFYSVRDKMYYQVTELTSRVLNDIPIPNAKIKTFRQSLWRAEELIDNLRAEFNTFNTKIAENLPALGLTVASTQDEINTAASLLAGYYTDYPVGDDIGDITVLIACTLNGGEPGTGNNNNLYTVPSRSIGNDITIPAIQFYQGDYVLQLRLVNGGQWQVVPTNIPTSNFVERLQTHLNANDSVDAEQNNVLYTQFFLLTLSGTDNLGSTADYIIERGVNATITLTGTTKYNNALIDTAAVPQIKVGSGTYVNMTKSGTGTYTYSSSINASTTYTMQAMAGGVTKTVTRTVNAYLPMFFGGNAAASLTAANIQNATSNGLAKQAITASPAGTYAVNIGGSVETPKYLYFVVPSTITINTVKSNGFDIPIQSAATVTGVTMNGVASQSYKVYRSIEQITVTYMNISLT